MNPTELHNELARLFDEIAVVQARIAKLMNALRVEDDERDRDAAGRRNAPLLAHHLREELAGLLGRLREMEGREMGG